MKKSLIWFLPLLLIGAAAWTLFDRVESPPAKNVLIEAAPKPHKEIEATPVQPPVKSDPASSLYSAEGDPSGSAQVPQKWLNNGGKAPDTTEKPKASSEAPAQ